MKIWKRILRPFGRLRAERSPRSERFTPYFERLEDRIVLAIVAWDGGGLTSLWTDPGNWVGDTAPVAADILVFPDAPARKVNTNDYASGTGFDAINLAGSGYTINDGGAGVGRIDLGAGGLSMSVAGANTVNIDLSMAATRPFDVSDAGGTLTLGAVLSGAGGLTKTGTGILDLSGSNTYTGVASVSAGSLLIRNSQALGSTSAATTVLSGAALVLGVEVIGEALTLNGNGPAGGGALRDLVGGTRWAGDITLASDSSVGANSVELRLEGVMGESGGSRSLAKVGSATLVLAGANTFTGTTTVNAGTLLVDGSLAAGAGRPRSIVVPRWAARAP